MKREDMKSFDELMNLFDHESLIEEEIILIVFAVIWYPGIGFLFCLQEIVE